MTSRTTFGILVTQERRVASDLQSVIDLYESLRPSLHGYLYCLGMSPDQAEDIVQETFLRLVRHLLGRVTEDNPRRWIFRVAHNLCMDLHRSQRLWSHARNEETLALFGARVDPAPDPEQKVIEKERYRRFGAVFAQLTPKQRHCVLLRAEGLRYREIASTLGISVQRVGEIVQRAITLLACDA